MYSVQYVYRVLYAIYIDTYASLEADKDISSCLGIYSCFFPGRNWYVRMLLVGGNDILPMYLPDQTLLSLGRHTVSWLRMWSTTTVTSTLFTCMPVHGTAYFGFSSQRGAKER